MLRKQFIDRYGELELLDGLWNRPGFSLFILYGRRRIGKTRLLVEFAKGKKCVYYTAMEGSYDRICREFSETVKRATGVPLAGDVIEILEWLARNTKEKLLVIIDEFQYIVEADPSIVSRLQRSIDSVLSQSNLMLVLCGSAVSFFKRKFLGYRSPLFGRRTSSLKLAPLSFKYVRKYFSNYTIEDAIAAYSIVGGTPAYIIKLDPAKSLEENILSIITPGSYLYDEAVNFLRQEVREPKTYFNILAALSEKSEKMSALASAAKVDPRTLPKYIELLEELDVIEKIRKLGGRAVKIGFKDNYFRFWFTYIYRLRSLLEAYLLDEALDYILSTLDQYLSKVFEKLCSELLPELYKHNIVPVRPVEKGSWWGKQAEIDIIVREPGKATAFIEVKWRRLSLREAEEILDQLEEKSSKTGLSSPQNYYILICKEVEEKTPVKIDTYKSIIDLNIIEKTVRY